MTTISEGLRITIENVKSMYGDNLPKLDENMYRGRNYTMAAASCYAAAYAAAGCNRDNMAMQFYRHALRLSDALAPSYPREKDEQDNPIERPSKEQLSLDSELKASHMAIVSRFGILTYLHCLAKGEKFPFIRLYHAAHVACRTAFEQAKDLRHSPNDQEFSEVAEAAVEAIGVFYNSELAIWTNTVTALENGTLPELTPDNFIAERPTQRRQHSEAQLDAMMTQEQTTLGALSAKRNALVEELEALNEIIEKQTEVAKASEDAHEKAKDEMDLKRREMEAEMGKLSERSMARSDVRMKLMCLDGTYFRLEERLQSLVNIRAYGT